LGREQRKLAAILAADVVGYARLMGRDESGTLAALKGLRGELIDPKITEHNGRIVKTTGDGVLVEFASAVDAARCAVEVQNAMTGRNAEISQDRRIEFRIGIHVGDIIIDGDDIFGDGVNIAARIEGAADPGGVMVSRAVYEQVRDRIDVDFDDKGEVELKNIARPIHVFAVAGAQPAVSSKESAPVLNVPDKPSIAVLAFNNMSGDPQQEYFSDGITEDIISSLSRHHGIFVIARNSSFAYKGQAIDVSRVGRDLGVRYVLEGSVRRAGDRVRIAAQLIEAEHRTHIWADKYDGELKDLFPLQDEITRSIVATVAPELLEAEMQRVRRKDPQALGAWECAMRAQWHMSRLTQQDVAEALSLATKATALDPSTTLGFNIAAFAHLYEVTYGWTASLAHSVLAAYQSASQAVALDSRDAVSQTALAVCEAFMGRPDDAIARLNIAIDLNPNFTWAHGNLGLAKTFAGRGDEAVPAFQEALRLSPRDQFNWCWHYLMGFALFVAGHYREALACAENSQRENSNLPGAFRLRAACLSQLGRTDDAKAALADFLQRAPDATVASTRAQIPLKRPEDLERYVDSLRRAGLRDN
jgi:adenylate cyclase